MFCSNCGKEVKENDNFCRYCGFNLHNEVKTVEPKVNIADDIEEVVW